MNWCVDDNDVEPLNGIQLIRRASPERVEVAVLASSQRNLTPLKSLPSFATTLTSTPHPSLAYASDVKVEDYRKFLPSRRYTFSKTSFPSSQGHSLRGICLYATVFVNHFFHHPRLVTLTSLCFFVFARLASVTLTRLQPICAHAWRRLMCPHLLERLRAKHGRHLRNR